MRTILFILITLLFFSCQKEEQAVHIKTDNLKFSKNILNYTITPKHAFDKDRLMFSDQGAWFAYSFPDSLANYAGFSGPFLMTQQNGVWSSTALAELHIKSDDKTMRWNMAKQESFNSHLEQQFINNKFNLKQTGPNWLDQAYFGVKGLRNYGFHQEADMTTVKILEGAEGILGKGKPIRENYHPITGEGLNAKNFSWSAAHTIMLLME